jgi:hypothetical protein
VPTRATDVAVPDVELFFDPVCPFCWQTSKWLRQVQHLKGLHVGYRFISLRFLNEPLGYDDKPEGYAEVHRQGTRLLRVAAATREEHGDAAVGVLYQRMGEQLWEVEPPVDGGASEAIRGHHASDQDIPAILRAAELPEALAEAADSDRYDRLLRDETAEALRRAGDDVGTPVLSFSPPDGPAFFGPVISDLPSDEDAVAYYDAIALVARWSGFAELKRSLRTFPDVRIGQALRDDEQDAA